MTHQPLLPALVDGVRDPAFAIDLRKRVLAMNAAAAALTGVSAAAARGRPCGEVLRCEACRDRCPLDTAVELGEAVSSFNVTVGGPCGATPVRLHTAPLRLDPEGPVAGVLETVRPLPDDAVLDGAVCPFVAAPSKPPPVVAGTPRMRELLRTIDLIRDHDAPVLIEGETGSGKTLLAETIHATSRRAGKPLITIDCRLLAGQDGSIPGLVEALSELFALSGAGTVVLDEVGDLPVSLQARLVHVLERQARSRVGRSSEWLADVRIVGTTARDLDAAVARGLVRPDLLYRLRVVSLAVPPLRERRGDVLQLATHALERLAARGHAVRAVSAEVARILTHHGWPGNVRELENVLEHAALCGDGGAVRTADLPPALRQRPPARRSVDAGRLLDTLAQHDGNQSRAARELGVSRTTVWRRLRRLHGPVADDEVP